MAQREVRLPETLERSLKMRIPRYDRDKTTSARVEELEEYLIDTARMQGDLTQEGIDWEKIMWPLEEEWANLTGWEHLRRTRTEAAVTAAKRMVDPELYAKIEDIKWIIRKCKAEEDRMERDGTKASRAYTMETGR